MAFAVSRITDCRVVLLHQGSYVIVRSVVRSVCEQDNSRTRQQTSTKHGRHGQGVIH